MSRERVEELKKAGWGINDANHRAQYENLVQDLLHSNNDTELKLSLQELLDFLYGHNGSPRRIP